MSDCVGCPEPKPEPRYEGRSSEGYCLDCKESYVGTHEECVEWCKKHREETGHRA